MATAPLCFASCFFFLPVPFKLPKLFDLSEWELLLASPADPDFALFPFSKKQIRGNTAQAGQDLFTAHINIFGETRTNTDSLLIKQPLHRRCLYACHFQDLNGEVCDAYLLWTPARARKLLWRPGLLLAPQPEPGGQEKKTQTEDEKQSTNLKKSASLTAVDRPRKLCMTIKIEHVVYNTKCFISGNKVIFITWTAVKMVIKCCHSTVMLYIYMTERCEYKMDSSWSLSTVRRHCHIKEKRSLWGFKSNN